MLRGRPDPPEGPAPQAHPSPPPAHQGTQEVDGQLLGKLQTLVRQLAEVVCLLPGAQDSSSIPGIGARQPDEQLAKLLRSAEQRAVAAEAKLVKLHRRLESESRQTKDNTQELNRLAFQDPLTGLANSNLMLEHVSKAVKSLSARQRLLLLVVDLDHFAVINQMLGHDHGDELLIRVSERLQAMAMEFGGAVGRFSEDEFILTLTVTADAAQAKAAEFGQTVRARLSPPFMLQGQKITLTVSQGGALAVGGEDVGRDLLNQARTALAHAKKNGRNQFHLYNPQFEQRLRREATMEFQLGFALEGGELFLAYQPIIWQDQLPGGVVQGRLLGVEALLRWRHRTDGVLPAEEFVEAAERSGRMVAIGQEMFNLACRDLARWRDAGADLFLTFNLSGRELLEPEIAARMSAIADSYNVPRDHFTFEFSEKSPTTDDGMLENSLAALKAAGFVLAVGHFGAGASSLRRLSLIQFIKLSPRLLRGDHGLVEKALSLAHGLGVLTVGVGVETAEEARYLLDRGCPTVQGRYFSQPLDADGILALYHSKPSWKL